MIRQELMDNIKELKSSLDGVINNTIPEYEKIGYIKSAYLSATKLEALVAEELESQRQEQLDYIPFDEVSEADVDSVINLLKEADEEIKMGIGVYDTEETKAFKRWCYYNNRSFNNGQVLNEYMKERGV